MKKINKQGTSPYSFRSFVRWNPTAKWEDFKKRDRRSFKDLKERVFEQQGWICGYCEKGLNRYDRLEHFVDRSNSDGNTNWDLEWNNIFGVCLGGSNSIDSGYSQDERLSCDSHKNRMKQKGVIGDSPEGYIVNPVMIDESLLLFDLELRTGEFIALDVESSSLQGVSNNFPTPKELIDNTIFILNLNCMRLKDDRKVVFRNYQMLLKRAREEGNTTIKDDLAKQWFENNITSFFTTKRILLGEHAEAYIRNSL